MVLVNGSEGIGTDWKSFSWVLSSLKVQCVLIVFTCIYMCLHVFTCVYCLLNVANPCLQNQALAGALQYQTTTHWTSLRRALYLGQPIVYLHGKKALAVHYYLWLWCLSKANMRLYIKKNLMLNYLRWICLQGQKCFQ